MIAQADSRKWMACLYNSFLFMEAKIMKMAKKLLALVLTGVMALSMLTGCALSDAAKAKALESALNSSALQTTTTYNHEKKLDSKAEAAWTNKDVLNKTYKTDSKVFVGTDKLSTSQCYSYFIAKLNMKSSEAKKAVEWTKIAQDVNTAAVAGMNTVAKGQYKLDGAKTSADAKNKVNFGVAFVDNGETGDKKVEYVVIVVKSTKDRKSTRLNSSH